MISSSLDSGLTTRLISGDLEDWIDIWRGLYAKNGTRKMKMKTNKEEKYLIFDKKIIEVYNISILNHNCAYELGSIITYARI
jgi:hypothetical protein